jgi:hypothetical protein
MIQKRYTMWRVHLFEDGVQLDSFLVRPEHINFWRTPGWWDERQTLEFTACHVSESQMRKAFPHRW